MKYTRVIIWSLCCVVLAAGCASSPKKGAKADIGANAAGDNATELVDYAGLSAIIAQAQEKRQQVIDNQLDTQDGALIEEFDAALREAEGFYNRGEAALSRADRGTAFADAQKALLGYTQFLDQYWLDSAADARTKSLAAQQDALKLKADIAVRDDYNLTTGIHNQGETAYRAREYQRALGFYTESITLYTNVAAAAAEKRRLATLALQSAEVKIAESEKIAANAEAVLNGAQAEGQL